MKTSARMLLAAALAGAGALACAHDSWLQIASTQPGSGLLALELGNGARYPRSEAPTPPPRLAQAGCVAPSGESSALLPRAEGPAWLELRARMGDPTAAACWVELKPQDMTLTPELVRAYFEDVRAPDTVRAAWDEQQRAGVAWREVYRKYIRVELPAPPGQGAGDFAALRRPRGFALEIVPAGGEPLRVGAPSDFLVLAAGRPLAGQAVEFVNRRSPFGIWRQSDAQGRIRLALPLPGEWLLRATALDPPSQPSQAWQSRFATLTVVLR